MDIERDVPPNRRRQLAIGLGVVAIILVTVAVNRLRPAVATVHRGALNFDTLRVGDMERDVRAPGSLVPERTRIIVAATGGRIEAIPVQPGEQVGASATIVQLSNPDVERAALEVGQSLTQSYAGLAQLRSTLSQQRTSQLGLIAQLRTQSREADRAAAVLDSLDKGRMASRNEVASARDRALELSTRYQLEQRRLVDLQASEREQLRLYEEQIRGLERIVQDQRNRVASMRVVSGEVGQVQSIGKPPLEIGQWVNSGVELARLTQPGRLKAVLRVPDSQVNEISVGQRASVDTHDGIVSGRVARIDPASRAGTVAVEIALEGPLPRGARADLAVEGTIVIERLLKVLHVGRPAYGGQESTIRMFRVIPNTGDAVRVDVELGQASVNTVQIRKGLTRGDSVIVSDMSHLMTDSRIRIE